MHASLIFNQMKCSESKNSILFHGVLEQTIWGSPMVGHWLKSLWGRKTKQISIVWDHRLCLAIEMNLPYSEVLTGGEFVCIQQGLGLCFQFAFIGGSKIEQRWEYLKCLLLYKNCIGLNLFYLLQSDMLSINSLNVYLFIQSVL